MEQAKKTPGWLAKVTVSLISTCLALMAAELVAGMVHGHAFPYLNIYQADSDFGVVLERDGDTGIRSREGRITEITTNAQGFRGDDWTPAPTNKVVPGRILLLGDSQMFGYGVEFNQTLATELPRALGHDVSVLNAAVPTWGPPEYVKACQQLVPTYRPQYVLFVANVANDWFEARIPNTRRTTAQDGWAAHRLHDFQQASGFPFRSFLMGKSHLVYAIRQWRRKASGPPPATAVSAERLMKNLPQLIRRDGPYRSRITRHLLAARSLCKKHGCEVIALTLPLDVQAHASEWKKYGNKPVDLTHLASLAATFRWEAQQKGFRTIDLLSPLKAASPGAFLPDDYHLSPHGHRVIAQVVAGTLREDFND
jgi:hypothetical protein